MSIAGTVNINSGYKINFRQHLLFWLALTIAFTVLSTSDIPFVTNFFLELLNLSFYAFLVYFNLYYLIPQYLKHKKLSKHLIWLLLISGLLTPIKTMVMLMISPDKDIDALYLKNQYFIFLSTFFVGASSSIYYILSDWLNSQKEKQELANKTLQSELKFLKSQINPHFLFNTLNSLYALTLKKSDLAPEIVLKLSEMMRYMLYECNEKLVPLDKEINYIINYLELEKIRHGKKIDIQFQQTGEVTNQKIAPLLFIPFIENCFKHGVSHQLNEAYVKIQIDVNGDEVSGTIENSKQTVMPGQPLKKSGGIGLINVRRRLDLLYFGAYKLKVEDSPNMYKVKLELKLI